MFERDYLMKQIYDLVMAVRKCIIRREEEGDPEGSALLLEAAIGEATDLDGAVLLSLSPDSIATILEVSGTDPRVTEYLARSLALASRYHAEAGDEGTAALRFAQAEAVAHAYGHDIDFEASEEVEEFFSQSIEEL